MKLTSLFLLLLILIDIKAQDRNTIIINANIITATIKGERKQALVISNGKFIYVGSNAEALAFKKIILTL